MKQRAILLLAAMGIALVLACSVALAADEPDYQAQIVGGTTVSNGEYPFMVSLQERKPGQPPAKEHFCGGTLIDRNSVLTAAHCAIYIKREIPLPKLRIVVGPTVLNSDQGKARKIKSLSDISIHPRYQRGSRFAYDAAVIKLNRPVSLDPIKLATVEQNWSEKPGRKAHIAGWGNKIKQTPPLDLQQDRFPNRIRQAKVPLVSDARAQDAYGSSYVRSLMVAAGKAGKGACHGDSGGPLWATTPQGRRQIGITSFGVGCGARGYPAAYAEVNASSIRNFIIGAAKR